MSFLKEALKKTAYKMIGVSLLLELLIANGVMDAAFSFVCAVGYCILGFPAIWSMLPKWKKTGLIEVSCALALCGVLFLQIHLEEKQTVNLITRHQVLVERRLV